jgi:hypothetical protein
MRIKNKWILFGVAIVLIAINLLNVDFSAYQQLSLADFLPVIAITLVSFLLKAGVLSALLIGIKNLCQWLKRK